LQRDPWLVPQHTKAAIPHKIIDKQPSSSSRQALDVLSDSGLSGKWFWLWFFSIDSPVPA
jgi:hypothetical protein